MKKSGKLKIVFLWIVFCALLMPSVAKADEVYGDYKYINYSMEVAAITDYIGSDSVVHIPSSIDGRNVRFIEEYAFANKGLTEVTIPDTVLSIRSFAFANNKLTNLIIPNSVTSIGNGAFNNNLLPDSQAFIYRKDADGFKTDMLISYGGAKKDNVIIPNTVTIIAYDSFNNVGLNSVVIPNSVISIANDVFINNNLQSITIPDSVEYISEFAFANNKITTLSIPDTVRTIGSGAFNNNLLPDDKAFIFARDDSGIKTDTLISYGGAKKDNVTIPSTVTTIGSRAFYGVGLNDITIPNNISSIRLLAFANNNIKTLSIPDTVTSLEWAAFNNNLLPDDQAFIPLIDMGYVVRNELSSYGGAKKENVTIPSDFERIGNYAFTDTNLKSINIPSSIRNIYGMAFSDNPYLTSVRFLGSSTDLIDIYEQAFYHTPDDLAIYGYTGSSSEEFAHNRTINFTEFVNLEDNMVSNIDEQEYDGNPVTPEVIVKNGTTTLVKDRDYKVTYENNNGIGTGKAIITGLNEYLNTIEKSFTIVLAPETPEPNPKTFDGINGYIILAGLSIIGLFEMLILLKKESFKSN